MLRDLLSNEDNRAPVPVADEHGVITFYRKIAVVCEGRELYGLLQPILAAIDDDEDKNEDVGVFKLVGEGVDERLVPVYDKEVCDRIFGEYTAKHRAWEGDDVVDLLLDPREFVPIAHGNGHWLVTVLHESQEHIAPGGLVRLHCEEMREYLCARVKRAFKADTYEELFTSSFWLRRQLGFIHVTAEDAAAAAKILHPFEEGVVGVCALLLTLEEE